MIIHFDGLVESAVMRAEIEARNNGHNMLGAEYLLLGVLQVEEFRQAPYFGMFGITAAAVNARIKLTVPYADKADPIERADCFNDVMAATEGVAEELHSPVINSTHLAYGLVSLDEGIAFGIMKRHSVDVLGMRATIRRQLDEAAAAMA